MRFTLFSVIILISLVKANILYDLSNEEYNKVKDSRNFTGKVFLVTGSSSGIGKSIIKLMSTLGAQVVVTGMNITTIKSVSLEVEELSPQKLKPLEVIANLTKTEDINRLLNETIKRFGKIDVLVNNAGIFVPTKIDDKNFMKTYDSVFNTNLRAATELNYLSVPYLKETKGTIIHISSVASIKPLLGYIPYSMAKSALNMMTKSLALELGPFGIRVNSISPGNILTKIYENVVNKTLELDKVFETLARGNPIKRNGQVIDIAKGVAFLASSDASFITGTNLVIDGGIINQGLSNPFD